MIRTRIGLLHNYDGCHTSYSPIGYIDCVPIVALAILFDKFYIARYCDEDLYSMSYVGYKYALSLASDNVSIDDDIELYAHQLGSYLSTDHLINTTPMKLAKVDFKNSTDYTNRLGMLINSDNPNDSIKIAIIISATIFDKYLKKPLITGSCGCVIDDLKTDIDNLCRLYNLPKKASEELFKYCISMMEVK